MAELDRAVVDLGLTGGQALPHVPALVPDDRDLSFPICEKALELGIPVMVHQAGSTRIDAKLELGRPAYSMTSAASSATSSSSSPTAASPGSTRR